MVIDRTPEIRQAVRATDLTTKVWRLYAFRRVQLGRAFILKRKEQNKKEKKMKKQLVESNESLRYVVACIQLSTR